MNNSPELDHIFEIHERLDLLEATMFTETQLQAIRTELANLCLKVLANTHKSTES